MKNNAITEDIKFCVSEYHKNHYAGKEIDLYKILNLKQISILKEFGLFIDERLYSYEECFLIKVIIRAHLSLRMKFKDETIEIINLLSTAME